MEHRVSNSQLEDLLDYLAGHPSLAKGVGLGARSKETIDREWNALAQKLNSSGSGASKSGQRWKRYWADIKHKTKSRAAARRRDASGTGGGPSIQEDLSETDRKILGIIGEAAVYGDTQHRVPVFGPRNEPQIVTQDLLPSEDVIVINMPEAEQNTVPEAIISSPSKSGHTSKIYTMKSPSKGSHIDVLTMQAGTASPLSSRPKLRQRTLFRELKSHNNSNKSNQTKVDPAWVVELETRRIAAEEKLANAAMIIAEAARTNAETGRMNAETARINAECARMHCEVMVKVIETLRK